MTRLSKATVFCYIKWKEEHIAYRLELSRIYEYVVIVNNIVNDFWASFSFYPAIALASGRGSLRIGSTPLPAINEQPECPSSFST